MAKPYALCGLRVNERPCPAPKLYVITIHTTKAASQTYSIQCIDMVLFKDRVFRNLLENKTMEYSLDRDRSLARSFM